MPETVRFHTDRLKEKPYSYLADVCFTAFFFFVFVLTARIGGFRVPDIYDEHVFPSVPVYLGDYTIGFNSRLLLGAVTKLFTETLTLKNLYAICGIAVILSLLLLAFLCGKMLRECICLREPFIALPLVLLAFDPMISQWNYHIFGSYDTYWLILFVLLMLSCKSRAFPVLAPIICVISMLIHLGFLLALFPAVAALLLYGAIVPEDKSKNKLYNASFFTSSGLTVLLFAYFLFFGNKNLKMDQAEFHEYLLSRLSLTGTEKIRMQRLFGDDILPFGFFENYFFSDSGDGSAMNSSDILSVFRSAASNGTAEVYSKYAAAVLPFLLFFVILWLACMKRVKGLRKLPFLAFAGITAAVFPAVLMSTDVWRWCDAAMVGQLGILFALIRNTDPALKAVLSSDLMQNKKFRCVCIGIGIIYLSYLLYFGRDLPKIYYHTDNMYV